MIRQSHGSTLPDCLALEWLIPEKKDGFSDAGIESGASKTGYLK